MAVVKRPLPSTNEQDSSHRCLNHVRAGYLATEVQSATTLTRGHQSQSLPTVAEREWHACTEGDHDGSSKEGGVEHAQGELCEAWRW